MTGKELYQIWAPTEHEKWTRFAKPALFVHANGNSHSTVNLPSLPTGLSVLEKASTAIIVDLPGAASVGGGLTLAKHGYMPVPLYNGIHEKNIGNLEAVVDNAPIIDALQAGVSTLDHARHIGLLIDATPAFLLDSNRSQEPERLGMYDNRWSIDIDDMPEAQYMVDAGIKRVVVWTNDKTSPDLAPILDSYQDINMEVYVLCDGKIITYSDSKQEEMDATPTRKRVSGEVRESIGKFENARVTLMLLAGMALVNLFFQFFVRAEPLLWTAPTIQWLTYLWVPEIVGDIIAVAVVAASIALYFLSQRRQHLMTVALIFYGADAFILLVYVLYYGVAAYTGYSAIYGLIVFGFPLACLYLLARGVYGQAKLQHLSIDEYYETLDHLDRIYSDAPVFFPRRRHFRGFRGYSGYGGSGRGGYRGSGYRGFGGGYGGGFGG